MRAFFCLQKTPVISALELQHVWTNPGPNLRMSQKEVLNASLFEEIFILGYGDVL